MTTVVAAVIQCEALFLICQRRRDKAFPLKWEFPGGKVEPGESLAAALARELKEELGIRAEIGSEIYRTTHLYPERSAPIEIVFFSVHFIESTASGQKNGERDQNLISPDLQASFEQVLWVAAADLPKYDFLAANAGLIERLAAGSLPPA